ncbi:MAG: hypothetical protein ABSF91_01485 [Bacteroidota bacterium]
MADRKTGKVIHARALSASLEIFRLLPEDRSTFPGYKAGQHIALSRDRCKLTKKILGDDGRVKYVYEVDGSGVPKRGPVTRSYSISSAPFETREKGYLEFYVALEMIEAGIPGRLSESLFKIEPEEDGRIHYVNKIVGEFTLEKRVRDERHVLMVGTGSGLAPFASMIKQLHFEAAQGKSHPTQYTLFHANRTREELGYHEELLLIEKSRKLDFVYVPSVSRPGPRDFDDPSMGRGRANNILRSIFDMPVKEQEDVQKAIAGGGDRVRAGRGLEKTTIPVLPRRLSREELSERIQPHKSVILTCGNAKMMEDIEYIAGVQHIRFEKEDW